MANHQRLLHKNLNGSLSVYIPAIHRLHYLTNGCYAGKYCYDGIFRESNFAYSFQSYVHRDRSNPRHRSATAYHSHNQRGSSKFSATSLLYFHNAVQTVGRD
jgi:hypothetical protein